MTNTPQPGPISDADSVYLADFTQAASDMALLYGCAWRALEQQLGNDAALELAPILLPQLVQSAQREAMSREAQRQEARERLALLQRAKQQQPLPPMPENPW